MMGFASARRTPPRVTPCWFRPLLPLTIVFVLGLGCRSIWPDLQWFVLLVAPVAFVWTAWQFLTHRPSGLPPLLLFWSLGYGALAPWLTNDYPQHHVIHFTDGGRYRLVGTVDQAPRTTPDKRLRLVLKVEELGHSGAMQAATGSIRLTVFGAAPMIRNGDRLALESRLRPIRNFRNPGGFDYQRYMALQKITATAWARAETVTLISRKTSALSVLDKVRKRFRRLIQAQLEGDARVVMQALTIGERDALTTTLRDVFNRCGIGHLLAISGLHVGIIAIVLMGAFTWFFKRFPFFLASGGSHAAAVCVTIPFVLAYGVLAGMAPSTQRAVIMVALGMGAYLARREGDTLNLVALAGLLILVWHPPMLFRIGFQMSFAAVLTIVLGLQSVWPGGKAMPSYGWRRLGYRLLVFMTVTLYATVGTLPLLMIYFQQFSLIGLVANLLAVPLVGFAALPLGLLSFGLLVFSDTLASLCLQMGGLLLDAVLAAAYWASTFDGIALRSFQPTGLEIGGYYALLASLMAMRVYPRAKWIMAAAAAILMLDAGWWYQHRFAHRDLRITVLDVGQGSATLVEFPGGQTMLVDGGGYADNRTFDMGRSVIAPYLRRQKILAVDYLVLSHPSSDHMNGLLYVLQQFHPHTLIWNHDQAESTSAKAFAALVKASALHVPPFPQLNRKMDIGGTHVQILNPPSNFKQRRQKDRWRDLNNNSIALQLAFEGATILIPGDIERPAEMEMLRTRATALKSSILLVPHHGSRTSSSIGFVKAVAPEWAIFSCGWRNRFGFPHPEVLARYQKIGSRVLRTDINGAVLMRLQAGVLQVRCDDQVLVHRLRENNG